MISTMALTSGIALLVLVAPILVAEPGDKANETDGTKVDDDFGDYFVHEVSGFHNTEQAGGDANGVEDEGEKRAPYLDTENWQSGWKRYPLYLIILGGFRWDYLKAHRFNLTSFIYLRSHGSAIPMVTPVFPPEDLPVWMSIATGLYPEEHNIIGDVMFDLRTRLFFDRRLPKTTANPVWWKKAEPFWSKSAKQGRKVALFNWQNCRLSETTLSRDADCRPYKFRGDDKRIQSRQKIARLFDEAFNLLYRKQYDVAVVYTDAIRRAAEVHGPLSTELNKVLHDIDDVLQTKLIDIHSKGEEAGVKMNLMVISDFGMSDDTLLEPIFIDDYLDLQHIQYVILSSGYAAIVPYALTHKAILSDCDNIPFGVDIFAGGYLFESPATTLPENLHYRRGEWTQDIIILAKPGYQLVVNSTDDKIVCVPNSGFVDDPTRARIGFNPIPPPAKKPYIPRGIKPTPAQTDALKAWKNFETHRDDMKTLAFAMGPDFRANYEIPADTGVEVIDFYQIFCFLLRIPAGVHSGSWERISGMLTISGGTEASSQRETHYLAAALASLVLGLNTFVL